MKTFIKKVALFASIPVICGIIGYSALSYWHNRSNIFKLDSNITTLFVGDSHIRYAIDDSMIDNSINLAQDSESYYFSYFILDRYLSVNKNIQRVFLGYGHHNLTDYYELFINGKYSLAVAANYFFNIPVYEQINCIRWNPHQLASLVKSIIKNSSRKETGFRNEFENVSASRDVIDMRLNFQFYNDDGLCSYSSINIYYLDKIIELCKSKEIELILLTTPIHQYYRENIPEIHIEKYYEIIEQHNSQVLDLSNLVLSDDCYMPEGDHLSKKGARTISAVIAKHEFLRNK